MNEIISTRISGRIINEFSDYGTFEIDGHIYTIVHIGLEDQKAYAIYLKSGYKKYYVEIIEYISGKYAYHIEINEKLVADSRISEVYYTSFQKCHNAAINKILKR